MNTGTRHQRVGATRGRLRSSASALLSAVLVVAQLQPALAAIVNTVTVRGTAGGAAVTAADTASVTVSSAPPELVVTKAGVYRDSDGVKGVSAGDTILYTITAANAGTAPLTGVTVSDPMIALRYVRGDRSNPGVLDPGETWTHEGAYTLTAADIDSKGGGDSDIDNTATVSTGQLPPRQVSAAVPLDFGAVMATVTGTVYLDRNGDGRFGRGDTPAGEGYLVELIDSAGRTAATALTDGNGGYSLTTEPGEGYTLRFRRPGGTAIGAIDGLRLPPGSKVIDQDMPLDPSGVIYDARSRKPLSGVTVTLTDASGVPLPAACFLRARQQNQVTGADGDYRFDLLPGTGPACPAGRTEYRIALTVPSGYLPGFSTLLPPEAGALDAESCPVDVTPGGACNVAAATNPPASGAVTYFTAFLLAAGGRDIVNNHIPVDPFVGQPGALTKQALATEISRGERVGYVIEAKGVPVKPVTLIDSIPPGFSYVPGSARVNGISVEPVAEGRSLVFAGLSPVKKAVKLELTLLAGAAVSAGTHVNTAELADGLSGAVIATARAAVTVLPEHVFDCGDVIGRVFDDRNGNGYADDGEDGIPGVRLATVNGLLVTTDRHGRFHVGCAELPDGDIGSDFVMKLDTRTLPEGYRVTSENPRAVRLTAGKVTKLNFGAAALRAVTLDLRDDAFEQGAAALKPSWQGGIAGLAALLARQPSALRVVYHAAAEDRRLVKDRLAAILRDVRSEWKKKGEPYRLTIETRITGKGP